MATRQKTFPLKSHEDLKNFQPELCVIKLGSSVVTDGLGKLDQAVLDEVADFVSRQMDKGRACLIVSSGAVAAGIGQMQFNRRPKGLPAKQALAAIGQGSLLECWKRAFGRHNRQVAQLLLTASDFDDRRRYLNVRYTLEKLRGYGVAPIINENDTVTVDELRFGDNDDLALLLALKMLADCMILLTSVGGLHRGQPGPSGQGELVEIVREITPEIQAMISSKTSQWGSGGMGSKLRVADQAARSGIPTLIAPGKQPGILDDLFKGKGGATFFPPHTRPRLNRRKRFIAFNRIRPRGSLQVDAGAVKALVERKKSLLPAGVMQCEGDFSRQDVVEVLGPDGTVVARGLASYNAEEIRAILGARTGEIEKRLGYRDYEEVIHRDNLVVFPEEEI